MDGASRVASAVDVTHRAPFSLSSLSVHQLTVYNETDVAGVEELNAESGYFYFCPHIANKSNK